MTPPIAISSPVSPATSSQVRIWAAKRVAVMFMLRVSFRLSAVVDDQPKVSPALVRRAGAPGLLCMSRTDERHPFGDTGPQAGRIVAAAPATRLAATWLHLVRAR